MDELLSDYNYINKSNDNIIDMMSFVSPDNIIDLSNYRLFDDKRPSISTNFTNNIKYSICNTDKFNCPELYVYKDHNNININDKKTINIYKNYIDFFYSPTDLNHDIVKSNINYNQNIKQLISYIDQEFINNKQELTDINNYDNDIIEPFMSSNNTKIYNIYNFIVLLLLFYFYINKKYKYIFILLIPIIFIIIKINNINEYFVNDIDFELEQNEIDLSIYDFKKVNINKKLKKLLKNDFILTYKNITYNYDKFINILRIYMRFNVQDYFKGLLYMKKYINIINKIDNYKYNIKQLIDNALFYLNKSVEHFKYIVLSINPDKYIISVEEDYYIINKKIKLLYYILNLYYYLSFNIIYIISKENNINFSKNVNIYNNLLYLNTPIGLTSK